MANLDKNQSATMSADQIKQNIQSALDIQLLPVETKREICKLYDIVAKAAIMKSESDAVEKAECEQIIQNNSELFSMITNPMFYSSILLGPVSDYFSDSDKLNMTVINGKHNYTALMFKSLTTFTGCASKVIAPADNVNVNAIPGLLQLYNTPEAEYDPSLDETFDFDKDSTESDVKWDDNDIFSDKEIDELAKEMEEEEEQAEEDEQADAFEQALTEDEKKLNEFVQSKYSQYINKTIQDIRKVYTALFSSGYGVIEPDGLICDGPEGGAFLHFSKNDYRIAEFSSPAYMDDIWRVLSTKLGLKQCNDRDIHWEKIEKGFNYFPFKLLEFTFGRCISSPEDITNMVYKRHHSSSSWKKYFEEAIEKNLKSSCETIVRQYIQSRIEAGISLSNKEHIRELNSFVQTSLLTKIYRAYTPCVIMSEISDGRVKIRVSDIDRKITPSIMKEIEDEILEIIGSGEVERIDRANSLTRTDNIIKEFEVVKDAKLCGAVPLFAYTALDKLQEQGMSPSWDNLVLGRAEDDSIYIANNPGSGNKLNFKSNTLVHISAGSRSGKGVMTLNILGSAIASGIPIFYLDSKPDMASLLRYMTGGKTFAVQGGEYASGADMGGVFDGDTEKRLILPDCVKSSGKTDLISNSNGWSAFQYFKALDFCIWLMAKVGKKTIPTITNDDRMVVVADEMWRFQGSFMPFLDKFKDLIPTKSQKDKGTASELSLYADKLTAWQIENINSWKGAKNATLKGTAPVLITIYQEMEKMTSKSVYNQDTKEGTLLGNGSVYRGLMDIGKAGLVGYSGTKPHQLTEEPKGRKFLTYANRYFAYVPDIEEQSESTAEFFKPFLILNDTENENDSQSYVGQLKEQLKDNKIEDPETVLKKHRDENGVLNKAIGFQGYIEKMGGDAMATLQKSYDLANKVLQQMGYFEASGKNDVFDYLYDFRPEFLPSWAEMDKSLSTGAWCGGAASESGESAGISDINMTGGYGDAKSDTEDQKSDESPINTSDTSTGATPGGYMQNEIDKAKGAAESTRNLNVISCREAYALVSMDNSVRDTLENRIFKEFTQQSPNFNLFKRDKTAYGLHHLCYNISIWGAILGYSRVPVNTNQNIKAFCENYLKMLVAGSISPDAIPRDDHIIRMAGLTPENINNMQSQGEQSVTEAEIPNENIDEEVDINSINPEEFTIDNNLKEKIIDNNRLAQILAALAASQFNTQNGSRVINTNNKMGQLIELNDTNFMNTRSPYTGSFMEKLLVRTESGRSQIFTNGIKAVIGAIDKKIPDRGAVTRIIASGNTLVVNGMLVDLAPVLDNNDYGLRFQDLVNVKQLLNHYKGIEELGLDNIMFEQIIEDYGTTAQELWLLFQNNGRLRKLIVQLTPGGEERVITRQDYRNHAAELQSSAKQRKFAMQTDAMANINNPRLSDLGVGVVSGSYKLAGGMGEQFVKRLTSDNPKVFSGLGFGLLAAAAGTFAVLGTGVGFVGDKIGGLFRRKK